MAGHRVWMPVPRAATPAAAAVAGLALGLAAESASVGEIGAGRAAADLIVGWCFLGAAIVALRSRERRAAALLGLTCALWLTGSFWDETLFLHRAPLVILVVGLPGTRGPPVAEWAVMALGVLVSVEPLSTTTAPALALGLGLAALAARRATAGAPTPVTAACTLAATAMIAGAIAPHVSEFSPAGDALLGVYDAALAGVGVCAAWPRPERVIGGSGAVADLVVELGGGADSAPVRDALARALGDPSLVVAYRVDPDERYVDERGRPVANPAERPGRVVTHVEGGGRRVAVLSYDPTGVDDPRLVDAVATAARLVLVNARLRAEVAAQLDDLRASRRRLLAAADDERARLEQRLHDGAERRLEAFAEKLAHVRSAARAAETHHDGLALLEGAARELERARADVRALARGLHPRTLSERGLRAALSELTEGSPLPVRVTVPAERYPPRVEATAYFVCAEALANAGKYARAEHVECTVTHAQGLLRVTVEDDGAGGAEMAAGTGLRGLADRVNALGGELRVVSPIDHGTRVTAEIPVRMPI